MKCLKCVLALVSLCALSQAQTLPPIWPGGVVAEANLGRASDHAETTLTVAATTTDTSFTVADASKFEVNDIITFFTPAGVDSGEKAWVSAVTSTTITVSARNVDGTAAQTHAIGDTVACRINSTYWKGFVAELHALESSPSANGFYQTVQNAGTSLTQRGKLNLIPGPGITLSCPDNSGAGSTDCTFSAPGATGTGTNWQELDIGGTAQTASPKENLIAGPGISISGAHNSGTNATDITISATGSGAGTKTAYAAFPAAGCAGSTAGAAIDLPQTGGPSPNCYGSTLRFGALDFTSGTNQSAILHFPLPGDWTSGSTVGMQLNWFSSAGSSSSTTWSAKTFCAASSSTVLTGTITWNTASTVTTVNPVTPITRSASILSGIAATGCGAALEQWIQIQRTDSSPGTVSLVSASVALQRTY